jgi:hypothetical protein
MVKTLRRGVFAEYPLAASSATILANDKSFTRKEKTP